jgi:predicted nuclease with TOPRIM domain
MAIYPVHNLNLKIINVKEKLKHLIAIKNKQKWDLMKLERENAELREANAQLKEEMKQLHKKYSSIQKDFNKSKNFAKIVSNKLTPTDGLAELKESVERYIQEIDKCIEILEDTL